MRVSSGPVGVVGAGFMGTGIAESAARAGFDVVIYEPEQAALDRSRQRIEASVARAVSGGKLTAEDAAALTGRIEQTTALADLGDAQVVVEAVFEDPAIKGPIFQQLDELLPPEAILASNTSSIPIAQIASWTQTPERVLGLHFFSPVPVMKLVEIVVGLDTATDVADRADAFARAIGKHPIRTKD